MPDGSVVQINGKKTRGTRAVASTEAADVVAPIPLNKSITNTEKDVNEEIRTSRKDSSGNTLLQLKTNLSDVIRSVQIRLDI